MTARPPRLTPLIAALLALFSQIAFATRPEGTAPDNARTGLAASLHICGEASPRPGHTIPHRRGLACQLCPLCAPSVAPAILPVPPAVASPMLQRVPVYRALFAVRAPPAAPRTTALPRGPPIPA